MTPAVKSLEKAKVDFRLHQYEHDVKMTSFGAEAVEKLNVKPEIVFKTLVTQVDNKKLVVAIIPVMKKLNLKAIAKLAKGKKAQMAEPSLVEKSTGYVLGGVSPFGQKKRLTTFIDSAAQNCPTVYVSGGKRGLEIEIEPTAFRQILNASLSSISV